MDLKNIKTAYFIGIGGIGMSAIARYFNTLGIAVHGYDRTRNEFTEQLISEGLNIHFNEDIESIPKEILLSPKESIVIYTPAIPANHEELLHLQNNNIRLHKRAEVLGIISKNTFTIAVAGTHGKTTTSSLIAHILNDCNINFTAFLGGISTNLNSNYIHKTDGIDIFDLPISVVEADEFDRSFLHLTPNIGIVTSTDADHLDIYKVPSEVRKSFQAFVNCMQQGGTAIIKDKLELTYLGELIRYGKTRKADARYSKTKVVDHRFHFQYDFKKTSASFISGIPGFHNVENATAAITACLKIGLETEQIKTAVEQFKGVKRRFEYIVDTPEHVVIDDYAHHPTELTACIESVRELYPDRKITGIFQPHLFSRTRDFADGFAKALDLLDECWLMDIYPARELPIEGINAEFLALKMRNTATITDRANILKTLTIEKPEVLVILGAGDIDKLIQPIRQLYA
ncbi:MAG: UDP-N-acetylmuramate--L-alanine ligase [Bacteroidota bacterium]